ncbi:hypothetical protein CHLNCDRAFT_139333 [Chlorella variabilis]|uniref:Mitochondrial carrier protein n=1 Tax=Chlorella variabilis TaxID=554065 RepID=E1ZQ15_CHLVA|nr:hypothetical protein CHLNCDRAFT_139333 [Chlorella variabilis]EFN52160.1 hypothetical protein CHLNCDRAFT_139333 [Chlorella variabilis]|eukprot:XP_005844262.1 hypothetical protein CHLNCDRAFT_139333 [Chlorella variabilis]
MSQRREAGCKHGAGCTQDVEDYWRPVPAFASLTQGVVTAATGAGVTLVLRRALTGTGMGPSGLGQPTGKEGSVSAAAASSSATMVPSAAAVAPPLPPAPPPPQPDHKPANDVVAGAMARAASQSTIHPLDTMKVRMQAGGRSGITSSSLPPSLPPRQAAPLERRLLEGVVGAAAGAGIIIGTYFAFYSTTKRFLREKTDLSDGATAFTAGAAAALGSSVVKVPLAVCIRSVQAGVYKNVFHAASSIVTAAGVRGLFTGFLPTVLEDVPDMAVKFAVYETMRNVHTRLRGGRPANVAEDLIMGGVAGAAAAAATTPLDVLKTVMMCSASSRPTIVTAAAGIMREGKGLRPFFRGVGPRALSNGLNSAIFFCFFEAIRQVLIKKQQERLQPGQQQQRRHVKQLAAAQRSRVPQLKLQPVSATTAAARPQGSPAACLTLALPAPGWQQEQ